MGESGLLELASGFGIRNPHHVICGVGDDCAVIRQPDGSALLLTSDVMTEGVHFLPDRTDPESIGAKLLSVNLSDIASMGGIPGEAILCAMFPVDLSVEWVERFYSGLEEAAKKFGVDIVGGDTSRNPDRIALALSLTGRMAADRVLYRSGSKAGDVLYVSGDLGGSDAGFALLKDSSITATAEDRNILQRRYLAVAPRIELGVALAECGVVTAMTDISDGLGTDLTNICRASGLSAEIDIESLPVSREVTRFCRMRKSSPHEFALGAGGDYELLFSVDNAHTDMIDRISAKDGLPALTRIGRLLKGKAGDVTVIHPGGRGIKLEGGGWDHFR